MGAHGPSAEDVRWKKEEGRILMLDVFDVRGKKEDVRCQMSSREEGRGKREDTFLSPQYSSMPYYFFSNSSLIFLHLATRILTNSSQ